MDLLARLKSQPLPFAGLLGIELVSATADRIVGQMTVRPELCTRPAVLHGGAIMAFADTLGALATVANLAEGTGTTTIESKTNFIGAAPAGARIIGETAPVHKGRRTMVWQTKSRQPKASRWPWLRKRNLSCGPIHEVIFVLSRARAFQPRRAGSRFRQHHMCRQAPDGHLGIKGVLARVKKGRLLRSVAVSMQVRCGASGRPPR